jgi:putative heme-binding domain-containing protein
MAALASLLDALGRSRQDLPKLANSGSEQLAQLVGQTGKIFRAARAIALSPDAALADRLSAVTLLGRDASEQGADLKRLGDLLSPQTPPVLQSAAVAALGSLDSSNVPAILLDDWRGHSPRLQQEILSVLSSRRAWLGALLAALEAKQIRPGDLDAATRERLLTQGSDESRERAKVALAAVASASREKVLADYQSVIGMSGNPIRGAEMFGRRCTTCHLFRARGNKVGPDLAALQDKSARNIVTAVLDPNRAVEWGFRTYVAAMESGRVFNGMIIAESTNSVTLAEPDGRQHVLLRADLEELSETDRSFMPEGLEQDLNPQDLADVFAFLQSGPLAVGSVDR